MAEPVDPMTTAANPGTAEAQPADSEQAVTSAPAARTPSAVAPDTRRRPMVERIGMAAIALVMAAMFAGVGIAAFVGGEPFLGIMGAIGALMVLWVGGLTLIRG